MLIHNVGLHTGSCGNILLPESGSIKAMTHVNGCMHSADTNFEKCAVLHVHKR